MGFGSVISKKDVEINVVKDFCGFLIGVGIIFLDLFLDDLFVSCMVYYNLFYYY